MKILKEYPPNFKRIQEVFNPPKGAVFTYGDTVYAPETGDLSPDLWIHESVHVTQQGKAPETWWDRYISNAEFRLSQEVEAYQAQFKFAKTFIKDRNQLFQFAHKLACDLAGPMYNNCTTYSKAFEAIGYKH